MQTNKIIGSLFLFCLFVTPSYTQPDTQQELQKLIANDGAENDWFGHSVSISGDYAIVGATYGGDNGSRFGSTYVFERRGEDWVEVVKLTASDGAANDNFGFSVSISGDYAIVGACSG